MVLVQVVRNLHACLPYIIFTEILYNIQVVLQFFIYNFGFKLSRMLNRVQLTWFQTFSVQKIHSTHIWKVEWVKDEHVQRKRTNTWDEHVWLNTEFLQESPWCLLAEAASGCNRHVYVGGWQSGKGTATNVPGWSVIQAVQVGQEMTAIQVCGPLSSRTHLTGNRSSNVQSGQRWSYNLPTLAVRRS